MTTRAHYHPRGIDIDLADLPRWLYAEIASLHGQIAPPPEPPVLTCLGNREPMYVYRHQTGRYFARHYPGGNPDQHRHLIATMSDEHMRQAEYSQRAAADHGLDAKLEVSTGNRTRLDLAVIGDTQTGFEIQRSRLSRAKAKWRAAMSFDAGWPTAWITDQERDPDWADHVPTARLSVRGDEWSRGGLPAPNTARVIVSDFTRERDRDKPSGFRYVRTPRTVLLDDLAYLMPAGEIIAVSIGTKGHVALADKDAAAVIDSCTYPGASLWRPTSDTPRQQESAQSITGDCSHPARPPEPEAVAVEWYEAPKRPPLEFRFPEPVWAQCQSCSKEMCHPQSIAEGLCRGCTGKRQYRLQRIGAVAT
jgi:hypothetical protein